MTRLHQLDGLRAVAAALVVFHHLGMPALGDALTAKGCIELGALVRNAGSSGVELFFVLSGVVLSRQYLREGRTLVASTFFRRRGARLLPAYWMSWLVTGLTIAVASRWPTWWTSIARLPRFQARAWLAQVGILSFGVHWNFACWSLTVEVIFYLLVPLLVPLVSRLSTRLPVTLLILAASVAVGIAAQRASSDAGAVVPFELRALAVYAPCFAAGLLISRADFPPMLGRGLIVSGVLLVFAAARLPVVEHVAYALTYAGVVSRALDSESSLSQPLSRWHLVWLGERSYSLFLVHGVVIIGLYYCASLGIQTRGAAYWIVTRILALPLSLIAAMVLFTFVEKRYARGLTTGDAFWPMRPIQTASDSSESLQAVPCAPFVPRARSAA